MDNATKSYRLKLDPNWNKKWRGSNRHLLPSDNMPTIFPYSACVENNNSAHMYLNLENMNNVVWRLHNMSLKTCNVFGKLLKNVENLLTCWRETADGDILSMVTVMRSPGIVTTFLNACLRSHTFDVVQPDRTRSLSICSTAIGFWCIPEWWD